ncbi:MAG: TatD family hydrolase [Candidatus Omnitrophica bacterium]|nr:TatD family hydrolase [Candidatus Omnitrophota bacterium]
MLIDTHCHLDFDAFDPDREEVIRRAVEAGVERFIDIGASVESSAAACALALKYPEVYAGVGVHPHEADGFDAQSEGQIRELAAGKKVVAVGEIGLDYYRNLSSKENQRKAFSKQLALAKDLGLPVVVHCREAESDTLEVLEEFLPLRAAIHCFSGGRDFLEACLEKGFYVSYTCNITYKKAPLLRECACRTPLEKLMLETDSPYLSPEGFRGKRNEPARVKILAEYIAKLRGISLKEISERTTLNAGIFFGLGLA